MSVIRCKIKRQKEKYKFISQDPYQKFRFISRIRGRGFLAYWKERRRENGRTFTVM